MKIITQEELDVLIPVALSDGKTKEVAHAHIVLQISEGTNSVGIVRLNLGFCLCAVIGSCRVNYKHLVEVNDML